jgi:hypothetical protein
MHITLEVHERDGDKRSTARSDQPLATGTIDVIGCAGAVGE